MKSFLTDQAQKLIEILRSAIEQRFKTPHFLADGIFRWKKNILKCLSRMSSIIIANRAC